MTPDERRERAQRLAEIQLPDGWQAATFAPIVAGVWVVCDHGDGEHPEIGRVRRVLPALSVLGEFVDLEMGEARDLRGQPERLRAKHLCVAVIPPMRADGGPDLSAWVPPWRPPLGDEVTGAGHCQRGSLSALDRARTFAKKAAAALNSGHPTEFACAQASAYAATAQAWAAIAREERERGEGAGS